MTYFNCNYISTASLMQNTIKKPALQYLLAADLSQDVGCINQAMGRKVTLVISSSPFFLYLFSCLDAALKSVLFEHGFNINICLESKSRQKHREKAWELTCPYDLPWPEVPNAFCQV